VLDVTLVLFRKFALLRRVGTMEPYLMPNEIADELLVVALTLRARHTGNAVTAAENWRQSSKVSLARLLSE
jgi:hypothetical protein